MLRRITASGFAALLCLLPVAGASATTAATTQTVVLVVDASGSMKGERLAAAIDASQRFLEIVPADDPIALVTFARSAKVIVNPTTDRQAVARAVASIRAGGDTALFDAVLKAIALTQAEDACTILLLADGEDTASSASRANATEAVRASHCTLNAVALRASGQTLRTLESLAAAGAGTAYGAFDATGIAAVFEESIATPSPTQTTAGPTPAPTTPSPPPRSSTVPGAALGALALMVASGLFVLIYLLGDGSARSERRRMNRLIETYAIDRAPRTEQSPTSMLGALQGLITPVLERGGRGDAMAQRLEGAEVARTPEEWVLIRVAASIMLGLALLLALRSPVGALMGPALGWLAPSVWLDMKRRSRSKRFEEALPDALMLMASSLRSGFALDQAILSAADQSDSDVSSEFKRAVQEMRIGIPLEDALDRSAARVASADFHWVVTALRIQRRSGGNLAELLVTASKTVRQRAELAREVRALTAEGRMSAYVLMALPIGLFAFLMLTQPGYLAPMWSTPVGWALTAAAVIMLLIGWLLMQKMVKVEV